MRHPALIAIFLLACASSSPDDDQPFEGPPGSPGVPGMGGGVTPNPNPPTLTLSSSGRFFEHDGVDRAPAYIQRSSYQQLWWCGDGGVLYAETDRVTGEFGPVTNAIQGGCDPAVVIGRFDWGDWAMYYGAPDGIHAAFSGNNGTGPWVEAGLSIAAATAPSGFLFQNNQIWLFAGTPTGVHLFRTRDAIEFDDEFGAITTNGIAGGAIADADLIYDIDTIALYLITDRAGDPSALDIYWLPWTKLQAGTWTKLGEITSEITGAAQNHSGGFLRNENGVRPTTGSLQLAFSADGNLSWATFDVLQ